MEELNDYDEIFACALSGCKKCTDKFSEDGKITIEESYTIVEGTLIALREVLSEINPKMGHNKNNTLM